MTKAFRSNDRGKTKEENESQTRVRIQPFSNPNEREELLTNIQISSEFNMRYRGLLEYYGNDSVAYKSEQYSDEARNEFLRAFSAYMSDFLEDDCPPSWKKCNPKFWEEFIVTFIPYFIKVTEDQKEVETFIKQLLSFVKWIDKRSQTFWSKVVRNYTKRYRFDLIMCERLINHLYLAEFPKIFDDNWNYEQDLKKLEDKYNDFPETIHSYFEIKEVTQDITLLSDLKTNRSYSVIGLPETLIRPNMIMQGIIAKKYDDLFWNWYHTDSIYPQKAKKFINVV